MSKIEEKSIRVIKFSRNEEDWKYWSVKIEARADMRGFGELLAGDEKLPTKSEYTAVKATTPETPQSKEKVCLYELGGKAFDELLFSCNTSTDSGKTAVSLITECKMTENPKDNPTLAWEKLKARFKASTAPSYIKLHRKYVNSKHQCGSNPDNWITELEGMRTEMNNVEITGKSNTTATDLIIHILASVSDKYDIPATILEDTLLTSAGLKLQTVRQKLKAHFDRLKLHKDEQTDDSALVYVPVKFDQEIDRNLKNGEDVDEVANTYMRQVKTNCRGCGCYGCNGGYRCPENSANKNQNRGPSTQNMRSNQSRFVGQNQNGTI